MKPVKELLQKEVKGFSIDPFAKNSQICTWNNDINPKTDSDLQHDALEFLRCHTDEEVDVVVFDPPYSPRQVSECYKVVGVKINNLMTSARFWSQLKDEVGRITKKGSKVISFGWNSGGIGKTRGFEIEKIIILNHGGSHHDTIVTVERKITENKTNGKFKCNCLTFGYCDVQIIQELKN